MSVTYLSVELRRLVATRAEGIREFGSVDWESGEFARFFNPRLDRWPDHFKLVGNRIETLTIIAAVTARILGFNRPERILERQTLQEIGRYPNAVALRRMQA